MTMLVAPNAEAFAREVALIALQALASKFVLPQGPGDSPATGIAVEDIANQSVDLLLAGRDLKRLASFCHIIIPPSRDVITRLGAINGLPTSVATSSRSWLLAAEIGTFCPMPLASLQGTAKTILTTHHEEWIEVLDKLRTACHAQRSFMHVPFLRVLTDEPTESWVHLEEHEFGFQDLVTEAPSQDLTGRAWLLRRPFITWAVSDNDPRAHTAMEELVRSDGTGRGFSRLTDHAQHVWRWWRKPGRLVRPALDYRAIELTFRD